VIIEAMKMKTPMIAHRAGTVTAIAVKAGEAVDAGQRLLSLA
jgi:biotin carboxyl carrier protein